MHDIATINDLLQKSSYDLRDIAHNSRREAELLLSWSLKANRSYLYINPDHRLEEKQLRIFNSFLQRRLSGEPLAYILEEWEFWSLKLIVNKHVLIPRPESELLVELTLKLLSNEVNKVADLGTGSGAIAIALASERRNWSIIAAEKSIAALQVAKTNAELLGTKNIVFYEGDWCLALPPKILCNAIVSNPPYVAINDPKLEKSVKSYEPELALIAGEDGLSALRIIIAEAPLKLIAGGWLILEHGYDHKDAVCKLMQQQGFISITCYKDFSGHDRVTAGRKKL